MIQRLALGLLLGLLVALSASPASAQPWAGILNANRATDWTVAGIVGGVPSAGWANCVTAACNTLWNNGVGGAQVTSANINSAITSALANTVVRVPAGTFSISGTLSLKSNVTLRGIGASKLVWTTAGSDACSAGGAQHVCMGITSNDVFTPQNPTNWTQTYTKGATQITVASAANITPNSTVIILDQIDDTSDSGSVLISDSIAFSTEGNSECRVSGGRRCIQEYHLVTAVAGNVLTISPGLIMPTWSGARSPMAWWATSPMVNAGIENLTLDHGTQGNIYGLVFKNCLRCWFAGMRSLASLGGGMRAHVHMKAGSAFGIIRDNYFYGTSDASTLSYGVELFGAGGWVVENNIFQHLVSPIVPGTANGNVFAYNYSLDDWSTQSGSTSCPVGCGISCPAGCGDWNMPGPIWAHDAGSTMNLSEGNQGTGTVQDNVHGTQALDTHFRNHWQGRDRPPLPTNTSSPTQLYHTQIVELQSYARYMNFIGNVMGEASYHQKYQAIAPDAVNCQRSIWNLGFQGFQCGGGANDARVNQTLMRWANYDVVNNAIQFVTGEVPTLDAFFPNAVPTTICTAALQCPASFYLPSQPLAWWKPNPAWGVATPPWPPIGPGVVGGIVTSGSGAGSTLGGLVHKIPARLCYENTPNDPAYPQDVAGLNVKLFDPAACYFALAPGSAPATPTGITVTGINGTGLTAILTGSTITVSYTEPTTLAGGGGPPDLQKTTICYQLAPAGDVCLDVAASSLSGGGLVSRNVAIPLPLGFSQVLTVSVTATNASGASAPGQVTKTADRRGEASSGVRR